MADMSLDRYIASSGINKGGKKGGANIGNNPRLHILANKKLASNANRNLGAMKRIQHIQTGSQKQKISERNKITGPSTPTLSKKTVPIKTRLKTANVATGSPKKGNFDARQRLAVKPTTAVTTSDARQKIIQKTQPIAKLDARSKIQLNKQALQKTRLGVLRTPSSIENDARKLLQINAQLQDNNIRAAASPKSILRKNTAAVKPVIRPITFKTEEVKRGNEVKQVTQITKTSAGPLKLTRTVNNEADTEMVKGVLQRTLNTKIANDSVVLLDTDNHNFTVTKHSPSKQPRLDPGNFIITKPNYQGIKVKPPTSVPSTTAPSTIPSTLDLRNDKFHFSRKRPINEDPLDINQPADYMQPTVSSQQRNKPNIIRFKKEPPKPVQETVTGAELRRQTSAVVLPLQPQQEDIEDEDSLDFSNIDTSLQFTFETDYTPPPPPPVVKPVSKPAAKPLGGPLKLYRPPKEESLPIQVARHTSAEITKSTETKRASYEAKVKPTQSTGPLKLARPNSAGVSVPLQSFGPSKPAQPVRRPNATTAPPPQPKAQQSSGPKLKPHPILDAETETKEPDILSPLQGYRIVVTNLHPVVNQDDVIELFGSVGTLKKAQLYKPGHASVVYQTKEAAIAAVRKFHSRELDGQPMQVKLVTSLTATSTGSTVMSAEIKALIAKSDKNEDSRPTPDVNSSLIQRALFKTGASSAPSKPVTFTVKI